MKQIPYGRQEIDGTDIEAVINVLKSDHLTQGAAGVDFEQSVSQYCGASYSLATSNGTSALHLACMSLGLGKGDTLWTSANTFCASANCARYCGAEVDFVDIDRNSGNLSVAALADKLEKAASASKLPRIVIPVHFSGQPCDMAEIKRLSEVYGFSIIEDACHALGSSYEGHKTGACVYSDATVFSFHPVKLITTGEGGMVTTNNRELYTRMEQLRNHGLCHNRSRFLNPDQGPWYHEQQMLGHNYRMTDIQAALGNSQLLRLDNYIEQRKSLADRYDRMLAPMPLHSLARLTGRISAHHLYVVLLNDFKKQKSVIEGLRNHNIGAQVHYIPVYHHPYYENRGFKHGHCLDNEDYYRRAISLPLYPGLSKQEQDYVVEQLGSLL